jgi:hypothetical protein
MKKTTRRGSLPKRLERAQAQAERAINRGYSATLDLLPAAPRKAVKELAHQLESTAEALTKRGQRVFKSVERRGRELVSRVERAVRAVERRRERAVARVETQRAKLASTVEHGAARIVRPLVRRLEIATLPDVERLSRRVAQLERRRGGVKRAA